MPSRLKITLQGLGNFRLRLTLLSVIIFPFWAVEFYFEVGTRIFFPSVNIFLKGFNKSAIQMIEFCMWIAVFLL